MILFLDDDILYLEYLENLNSYTNKRLYFANNLDEAINLVADNDIKKAFIDVNMPSFDGFDAIEILQHLKPDIEFYLHSHANIEIPNAVISRKGQIEKGFSSEALKNLASIISVD